MSPDHPNISLAIFHTLSDQSVLFGVFFLSQFLGLDIYKLMAEENEIVKNSGPHQDIRLNVCDRVVYN